MVDQIIYPVISLFIYDLKDGLGQDEIKISENCKQFCYKIYGDLDEEVFYQNYKQILQYKNTDAEHIELLDTRFRKFKSPLDGWYHPVQISDSYGLQVNYAGKLDAKGKFNDAPQDIEDKPFLTLKQEITKHIYQQTGSIGQTWLVWGKLTTSKTDVEIDKVAQDCYTQLISDYNWNRDFIGKGKLLGGTIFELWYRPKNIDLTAEDFWDKFRQENYHILIWLFPYDQTPDEMRKHVPTVNYDWMRLWQYRHKIVWAYYQSRYQKSILKREYVEIQPSINQSRNLPRQMQSNQLELSQLQTQLTNNLINLSDYTIALNYLDNQNRTLQVNLQNYQSRLAEMTKKYISSDLEFLKKFSDSEIYAQKYQRQIEADYANLSSGLILLQNLNNTIQGIIDLEQTKSDRILNTTIAITGIGLAISGLTATAISAKQPPITSYKDISFLASPVFVWSIVFSAPFLIALIFRLFRY